eukprot:CAMPEP_0181252776 /NCGR_PEP_ID=MMETSP1096-20121128/47654_1 /TAXON_ID=156174 ORGANISM="Chrysochromulina ericina, Strain CCMP281" /NCGR_SAMPLE_ID=MMETSP1096 /ASSEMBLY_ACC=CAM_ASM_000453 /LENGTH=220 /DNA_ID=CAMNT_0023350575 /DNA_START=108 /DNA_END=769 /DNA_ORIENTATION=+
MANIVTDARRWAGRPTTARRAEAASADTSPLNGVRLWRARRGVPSEANRGSEGSSCSRACKAPALPLPAHRKANTQSGSSVAAVSVSDRGTSASLAHRLPSSPSSPSSNGESGFRLGGLHRGRRGCIVRPREVGAASATTWVSAVAHVGLAACMVCTAGAVGAVGAAEARPVHLFPPPLGSRLLQVRTEVAESAGSVGAVGAVGGAAAEAGVAAVAAARV